MRERAVRAAVAVAREHGLRVTDPVVLRDLWEDTFVGPPAWDLACLVQGARVLGDELERERSDAALAAYDAAVEPEVLDLLVEARALQVAAWSVLIASGRPGRDAQVEARLRSCLASLVTAWALRA